MAPSSSSTTRSGSTRTRRTRKPRTRQYKKRLAIAKAENKKAAEEGSSATSDCFSKVGGGFDFEGVDVDDHIPASPCSTPKAQRFRIPEIDTCPPAPKKQRVLSNCSFRRKPIAFFASPDLELFFCFALRDISV